MKLVAKFPYWFGVKRLDTFTKLYWFVPYLILIIQY